MPTRCPVAEPEQLSIERRPVAYQKIALSGVLAQWDRVWVEIYLCSEVKSVEVHIGSTMKRFVFRIDPLGHVQFSRTDLKTVGLDWRPAMLRGGRPWLLFKGEGCLCQLLRL